MLNTYATLIGNQNDTATIQEMKKQILEEKRKELMQMIGIVLPNEDYSTTETSSDENKIIQEIAKTELRLELYAEVHKDELESIRSKILELNSRGISNIDSDELYRAIEIFKLKYKVFGRKVSIDDWKALYRLSFTVLTALINKIECSPFNLKTLSNEEKNAYVQIIMDKIELILRGENPEVTRAFPRINQSSAIKLIAKILKNGEKEFNYEKILENPYLLKFLLSFDTSYGLEKMSISKFDLGRIFTLMEGIYWNPTDITLDSVMYLLSDSTNIFVEPSPEPDMNFSGMLDISSLQKLYKMYHKSETKEISQCNNYFQGRVLQIPEGIHEISFWSSYDNEESNFEKIFSDGAVIVLPQTLEVIDDYASEEKKNPCGIIIKDGTKIDRIRLNIGEPTAEPFTIGLISYNENIPEKVLKIVYKEDVEPMKPILYHRPSKASWQFETVNNENCDEYYRARTYENEARKYFNETIPKYEILKREYEARTKPDGRHTLIPLRQVKIVIFEDDKLYEINLEGHFYSYEEINDYIRNELLNSKETKGKKSDHGDTHSFSTFE